MKKSIKERRIEHVEIQMYVSFGESMSQELGLESPMYRSTSAINSAMNSVFVHQVKYPDKEIRQITSLIDTNLIYDELQFIVDNTTATSEDGSATRLTVEDLLYNYNTMMRALEGLTAEERKLVMYQIFKVVNEMITRSIITFRLEMGNKEDYSDTPIRLIHILVYDGVIYDIIRRGLKTNLFLITLFENYHALDTRLSYNSSVDKNADLCSAAVSDSIQMMEDSMLVVPASEESAERVSVISQFVEGVNESHLDYMDEEVMETVKDVQWN